MNLKQFLAAPVTEGKPKFMKTKYDPTDQHAFDDEDLKVIKRKIAGAKTIEEIRDLLNKSKDEAREPVIGSGFGAAKQHD